MNRLLLRLGALCLAFVGLADCALGQDPLELLIDIDTGEASISAPGDVPTDITGYGIESASGALLTDSFVGVSGLPGFAGFEVANPTANGISELNPTGQAAITSTAVPLGMLIESVTLPAAPLGQALDTGVVTGDLTFTFVTAAGEATAGTINIVGDNLVNNLVLTINATSGEGTLTNDSTTAISLGGYTIGSEAGSLVPTGFAGIGDPSLDVANPTATNLSELATPTSNGLLLSGGASLSLGVIFDTNADVGGVTFDFLFSEGDAVPGDYNENGVVDAADYTVYRDNFGVDGFQLANETATPGEVTLEDFQVFVDNFGSSLTDSPVTFESLGGVVVFEAVPPAASSTLAAVPEPGAAALLLIGLACGRLGRSR